MAVVSKEQVFSACDQLKQAQGRFTQADVVAMSGGSLSKIGPWVREWQEHDQAASAYRHISPLLLDQLNSWCSALKLEMAKEYEEQLAQGQRRITALEQELQAAEEREYLSEERLNKCEQKKEGLSGQLEEKNMLIVELKQRVESNNQQHKEQICTLNTEVIELKRRETERQNEVKALQIKAEQQLTEERARITAVFEASENKLFQQLDQLRQAQQQERQQKTEELAEQRKINMTLQQQNNQLIQDIALLQGEAAQRTLQVEQLNQSELRLRSEAEQVQVHFNQMQQQNQQQAIELQGQLARAQGERDQICQMREQLSQQVDQLQQQLIDLIAQRPQAEE